MATVQLPDGSTNVVEAGIFEASVYSIIIVFCFFTIASLVRAYIRKATKCTRGSDYKKANEVIQKLSKKEEVEPMSHFESFKNDEISLFMFLTWFLVTAFCFYFFIKLNEVRVLLWGALGSLSLMFFFRAVVFLRLNHYNYIQNISKFNRWTEQHNANLEKAIANRRAIR